MDRETDRILEVAERRIAKIYADNAPLRNIDKKYKEYMSSVKQKTEILRRDYLNADAEHKEEAKKAYMKAVRELTYDNLQYKKLVDQCVEILAKVNQEALDVTNDCMLDTYVSGYNDVAGECRKAGIEVG